MYNEQCTVYSVQFIVHSVHFTLYIEAIFGKAEGVLWLMEFLGKCSGQNQRGRRPKGFWPRDFPRDSTHHDTPNAFPLTMIHPMLFILLSSRTSKEGFLHYRQTQPAPRKYHTQYYIVEVLRLVE